MRRATAYQPPGDVKGTIIDTITLPHDARRLRRKLLTGSGGTDVLVDFPATITLDHGSALVLDDGNLLSIQAAEEPLYEIRGRDQAHLLRLAWHIGNRHTPAQLGEDRILIARDHVLRTMLEGLGARLTPVTEPFFAEHGAYHAHDHGSGQSGHALLNPR